MANSSMVKILSYSHKQWRLQACEDDDAAFQEEATKAGQEDVGFHRLF